MVVQLKLFSILEYIKVFKLKCEFYIFELEMWPLRIVSYNFNISGIRTTIMSKTQKWVICFKDDTV